MDVCGAGIARKDSIVDATNLLDPLFHRFADVLATNMTAWSDPDGMVIANRALRGISVWVACDTIE
jgi:hypothetical protein